MEVYVQEKMTIIYLKKTVCNAIAAWKFNHVQILTET